MSLYYKSLYLREYVILVKKRSRPISTKKRNFPFSTNNEILEHIMEEAQNKNQSINALINDILTRHVTYYKHIERKGKVVVPNKSFQFMLDNVKESELSESIKKNELDISTLFVANGLQFTLENFIKYALDGVGLMGGFLRHYTIYKDNQDYVNLILEHNYDIKWSRIIGNVYSDILKEIFQYSTQYVFNDNSIVIKILEKHILD